MIRRGYCTAFTITEAIVSMVITGVILAIIFVIFQIASERLHDFRKQNEEIADLNRFKYSMNKSIFESETISRANSYVEFKSYYDNNINYHIKNGHLIRQEGVLNDTFKINVKSFSIDTLRSAGEKVVFQRLKWSIFINNSTTDLVFFKRVYAENLLRRNYEF